MGLVIAFAIALVGCGGAPVDPPSQVETAGPAGPALDPSIPEADPAKYADVFEAADWKNPFLTIGPRETTIATADGRKSTATSPEEVAKQLAALPPSAWPYGRVVAAIETGPSDPNAAPETAANRARLAEALQALGVTVEWWPSA